MPPKRTRRPSWLRRNGAKLVISLLLGAGALWLLNRGALPLMPSEETMAEVSWLAVAGYFALWSAVHWLRAARWHWLLAPLAQVSQRRIITASFIAFAAIVMLPLRTGEVVRPLLIRRRGELSGWAATGTIGAERIFDGLVLCVILAVALVTSHPLDPLPDRIGDLPVPAALVPTAVYSALALFGCAFVAMGAFYWRRSWAIGTTRWALGWVAPQLAEWLAERVSQVADGLRFLPSRRHLFPFAAATLAYWLLNAGATWVLARGCGFDMSYGQACVCMGVLGLGILMPNAPGYFGAFQMSIYAALAVYYPPDQVVGTGAAFVLVMYVAQTLITLLAAAGALAADRLSLGEAFDPSHEADAENLGPAAHLR